MDLRRIKFRGSKNIVVVVVLCHIFVELGCEYGILNESYISGHCNIDGEISKSKFVQIDKSCR